MDNFKAITLRDTSIISLTIPEDGYDTDNRPPLESASSGWNAEIDGVWVEGETKWLKVPGYCHATITCGFFDYQIVSCCRCLLEILRGGVRFVPDSGSTTHVTNYSDAFPPAP